MRDAGVLCWQNQYWLAAHLAVKNVSPDDPERDTKVRHVDYAEAGTLDDWLVDPIIETITVLRLEGDSYPEHGIFHDGENATSMLLSELTMSVVKSSLLVER